MTCIMYHKKQLKSWFYLMFLGLPVLAKSSPDGHKTCGFTRYNAREKTVKEPMDQPPRFDDVAQLEAFCDTRALPFVRIDEALQRVGADEGKQEALRNAYGLEPMPPTQLREEDSDLVAVLEHKNSESNYHGEVVSTVAHVVQRALEPQQDRKSLYIGATINPDYRRLHTPHLFDSVQQLLESKGIAAFNTSIRWNNEAMRFDNYSGDTARYQRLHNIRAFVVDSAGNDGAVGQYHKPYQKHNMVSHVPPLVVRVGAASKQADGSWAVDGYSAANGPAFVAPVAEEVALRWGEEGEESAVIGTSVAAPCSSAMLSKLNKRFGAYLTKEQILYGVLASCDQIMHVKEHVMGDENQRYVRTPKDKPLHYLKNAAGMNFDPEYAGFGLINVQAANHILSQMVAMAQKTGAISQPQTDLEIVKCFPEASIKQADGKYHYTVQTKPGLGLKTVFALEYDMGDEWGNIMKGSSQKPDDEITVISPSATRLPLVLSKCNYVKNLVVTSSHAFAGEETGGMWEILTDQPLRRLCVSQHHFQSHDLVRDVSRALLQQPIPDLSHARTMYELQQAPDATVQQVQWVQGYVQPPHSDFQQRS